MGQSSLSYSPAADLPGGVTDKAALTPLQWVHSPALMLLQVAEAVHLFCCVSIQPRQAASAPAQQHGSLLSVIQAEGEEEILCFAVALLAERSAAPCCSAETDRMLCLFELAQGG